MRDQAVPQDTGAEGAQRHIPALDGIRGLAILLVLMVHLFWSNSDVETSYLLAFVSHVRAAGWVGVDLFFALSGFLITGILCDTLRDPHYLRNFYARRALRIFPVYYGFLVLLLVVTRFTADRWSPSGLVRLLTYTINLSVDPLGVVDTKWINLNHLWSLATEEQFYLVWPLLVFLLRTPGRIAAAASLGVLVSLGLRLGFYYGGYEPMHTYTLASWTPMRLDGLFFGALLALAVRREVWRRRVLVAGPWVLLACGSILAADWVHDQGIHWEYFQQRLTWGLTVVDLASAALVACALRRRSWTERLFATAPLRFFGRYSYGIYIYHFTIVGLVVPGTRGVLLAHTGSKVLSRLIPGVVAGALSVAVAWLSFRYFEQPILRWKRPFRSSAAPAGPSV